MSEEAYGKLWPTRSLDRTDVELQSYLGEPIPVVGSAVVHTNYENQTADLPLIVVKGNKPTLLGRSWLHKINLNWNQIKRVQMPELQQLLDKYSEVFSEELGTMTGPIELTPDAKPRYHKA